MPNQTTHAKAIRDAVEHVLEALATDRLSDVALHLQRAKDAAVAAQSSCMDNYGAEVIVADAIAEMVGHFTAEMSRDYGVLNRTIEQGESMPAISVEEANAEVAAMKADRAAWDDGWYGHGGNLAHRV